MSIDLHERPLPALDKPTEPFVPPEQPDPRLDEGYSAASAAGAGVPAGDELSDDPAKKPLAVEALQAKPVPEEHAKRAQVETETADTVEATTHPNAAPTDEPQEHPRPAAVASGEIAARTVLEQPPAETDSVTKDRGDTPAEDLSHDDTDRANTQARSEDEHPQAEEASGTQGGKEVLEGRHKEPTDQNGHKPEEEKITRERDTEEPADQEPAGADKNPPSPPDKGNGGGSGESDEDPEEEPPDDTAMSAAEYAAIRKNITEAQSGKHRAQTEGRKGAIVALAVLATTIGAAAYIGTQNENLKTDLHPGPPFTTVAPEGLVVARQITAEEKQLATEAIKAFTYGLDINGGKVEHTSKQGRARSLILPTGDKKDTTFRVFAESTTTTLGANFQPQPNPATIQTFTVEQSSAHAATVATITNNSDQASVQLTTTLPHGRGNESILADASRAGVFASAVIVGPEGRSRPLSITNPAKIMGQISAAERFAATALKKAEEVALRDELKPPPPGIFGGR